MNWIDINDEAPPARKWLLFFTKDGEVIHDFIIVNSLGIAFLYEYKKMRDYYGRRCEDIDQNSYKEHITHWMLEPLPPKAIRR